MHTLTANKPVDGLMDADSKRRFAAIAAKKNSITLSNSQTRSPMAAKQNFRTVGMNSPARNENYGEFLSDMVIKNPA